MRILARRAAELRCAAEIRIRRWRRDATALDERGGIVAPDCCALRLALSAQLPPGFLARHGLETVVLQRVGTRRVSALLCFEVVLPWPAGDAVREDGADHLAIDDELHEIGRDGNVVYLRMLNQIDTRKHRHSQRLRVRRV